MSVPVPERPSMLTTSGWACLLWVSAGCASGGKGFQPHPDSGGANAETGMQSRDSVDIEDSAVDSESPPVDLDGDGYTDDVDCDDLDAAINPGATEICGDDIDENCNGYASGCMEGLVALTDADAIISAETWLPDLLERAPAGDVNGDGINDLLIGAPTKSLDYPGDVYVFLGGESFPETVGSAWLQVVGIPWEDFGFGAQVFSLGDVDGDEMADIGVYGQVVATSPYNAWAVHVFSGLAPGSLTEEQEYRAISGPEGTNEFWSIPSGKPDLSDTGVPVLVLGGEDRRFMQRTIVWLCDMSGNRSTSVDDCETTISDDIGVENTALGGQVADVDGDGTSDLLFGNTADCQEPDCSAHDHPQGAVYVFDGPLSGAIDLKDFDQELQGVNAGDWAGSNLVTIGDADGDGYTDMATTAQRVRDDDLSSGAVYIVHGPLIESASLSTAEARIAGDSGGLGDRLDAPGDVNNDGIPDLIVGSSFALMGTDAATGDLLFDGDLSGFHKASSASAYFVLDYDVSIDYLGTATHGVGDINNDGTPDIGVGDWFSHNTDWATCSRTFFFFGSTSGI